MKGNIVGEDFLVGAIGWMAGNATGRGRTYRRRSSFGGRGRRVMSSVWGMLRLRVRWDFQFIFNTHENTLAIPVPELAFAKTPISSGNWCVKRASIAVKEHSPAVKRIKKGSSFFG